METIETRVCPNCGKLDKTGLRLCESCGFVLVPFERKESPAPVPRTGKKRAIWLGAIASAALILCLLLTGFQSAGKSELHGKLQRLWSREEEENGTHYTLELHFTDDAVLYNFKSAYSRLNTNIAEYDYQVLSRDRLRIGKRIFTVQFEGEDERMTLTPSLTDSSVCESWFGPEC